MWHIVLITFGTLLHHVSLRQRHDGCECVTVNECFSNGVDVAPYCGCMDMSNEDYVICYTTRTCPGAIASTVFTGATYRPCVYSPPPPPHAYACNDPLFASQWHLNRVDVPDAWSRGSGGATTSVVIMDDGLQYSHDDLRVDRARSFGWDTTSGKRLSTADAPDAMHGTASAGVAVAVRDNLRGGCGVAWGATLIGVRLLNHGSSPADNVFLSDSFAQSLRELSNVSVISNSWGPPDDGRIDGPTHRDLYAEVEQAMRDFYSNARNGKGGILVFANGNGGRFDNSNDDGFASHFSTISVGAVGDDQRRTSYTEPGTCIDVVAPSDGGIQGIVTADLVGSAGYQSGNFTTDFGGTSASAPVVAGIVALMLEVRPDLSALDVRHILARTAHRVHPDDPHWVQNAAGVWYSPWYGFGMVNARDAVDASLAWTPSPTEARDARVCSETWFGSLGLSDWEWRHIPVSLENASFDSVDRVFVFVDIDHPWRGDVIMRILSPSGTTSQLTFEVPNTVPLRDTAFVPHTYTSNAFYRESSQSQWWMMDFRDVSARGRVRRVQLCVSGRMSHSPPPPPSGFGGTYPPPPPPGVQPPSSSTVRIVAWSSVGGALLLALVLLAIACLLPRDDEDEDEKRTSILTFLRRVRLASSSSSEVREPGSAPVAPEDEVSRAPDPP